MSDSEQKRQRRNELKRLILARDATNEAQYETLQRIHDTPCTSLSMTKATISNALKELNPDMYRPPASANKSEMCHEVKTLLETHRPSFEKDLYTAQYVKEACQKVSTCNDDPKRNKEQKLKKLLELIQEQSEPHDVKESEEQAERVREEKSARKAQRKLEKEQREREEREEQEQREREEQEQREREEQEERERAERAEKSARKAQRKLEKEQREREEREEREEQEQRERAERAEKSARKAQRKLEKEQREHEEREEQEQREREEKKTRKNKKKLELERKRAEQCKNAISLLRKERLLDETNRLLVRNLSNKEIDSMWEKPENELFFANTTLEEFKQCLVEQYANGSIPDNAPYEEHVESRQEEGMERRTKLDEDFLTQKRLELLKAMKKREELVASGQTYEPQWYEEEEEKVELKSKLAERLARKAFEERQARQAEKAEKAEQAEQQRRAESTGVPLFDMVDEQAKQAEKAAQKQAEAIEQAEPRHEEKAHGRKEKIVRIKEITEDEEPTVVLFDSELVKYRVKDVNQVLRDRMMKCLSL